MSGCNIMNDLIKHIQTLNQDVVWQITENPEHWKNFGIETVEQFERYTIECAFSEAWKGCYGVRPRGSLDHFTIEELETMTKDLSEQQLFDGDL
mgnify:FL=1|jgi:hypothetical protein